MLKYLAETYDTEAHYWGHLARYYSSEDANFIEADRCCGIAIRITEESDKYDPIIYHIKGGCVRKEAYEKIIKLMGSADPIAYESLSEVRDLVDTASFYFEQAKNYGQIEFGVLSQIEMLVRFLEVVFKCYNIMSSSDLADTQESWILEYGKRINDLFFEVEKDDLSDKALSLYERAENKYNILIYRKAHSEIIQSLTNKLDQMKRMPFQNNQRVCFIRRSIIETILHKNNGMLDKIKDKDKERILGLVRDSIDDGEDSVRNYILWIKIAKGTGKSVDKAIEFVRKWYNSEKDKRVRNPQPAYYMFVLHFLREIEGFVGSINLALDYLKECREICQQRQRISPINITRVRDWFGAGNGLEKLVDGKSVIETELLKDGRIAESQGIFLRWEHDGKGYISNDKVENIEVFFKPSEAKLGKNQQDDRLSYKFGFSYDGLIAYNRSIRDLDAVGKKSPTAKELEDRFQASIDVKVGDIVEFIPKQVKRGLLIGNIQGTIAGGAVHISEISYDRVTSEQLNGYIGKQIRVKVIEVDEKHNIKRYRLSIKQLHMNNNHPTAGTGTMELAFEKAKRKKR